MFCSNCGFSLPNGAKFCGRCGQKVRIPEPAPEPIPAFEPTPAPEPMPAEAPAAAGSRLMRSGWVPVEEAPVQPEAPMPAAEPEIPAFEEPVFAAPEPEAPVMEEPVFAPEPEAPVMEEPVFAPEPEAPVFETPRFAPEPEQPTYRAPAYAAPQPEAPVYEAPRYEQPRFVPQTPVAAPEEPVDQPVFLPEKEPELPKENRPLSPWAYFGYGLLFSIPVIGWILLIVLTFAAKNVNLRNFARSYWCGFILILAVVLILLVLVLTGILKGPIEVGLNWLKDTGLGWLSQTLVS